MHPQTLSTVSWQTFHTCLSYRIFIKDLRFSRLLLCALAIASHLSFARNDRLRVLFVIASEAKQSLSKPQLFSEVSIAVQWRYIDRNVVSSVVKMRVPERPRRFLSQEEIRVF